MNPFRLPSPPSLALAAALAALAPSLAAEPLVTDRPDATESSSVVGTGVFQLETGVAFAEDSGVTAQEYLSSLLRVGLDPRTELRLAWDGFINVSDGGPDGAGDMAFGFKRYLREERGAAPEAALLVHLTAPVGDDAFSSDEFDPSFLFAFSHTLNERSSIGYNVGASLATSEFLGRETTLSSIDYSVAYGFDVAENLGAYVELFGSAGLSASDSPFNFNGGFAYLLDDDAQLDLFVGAGLNSDAPDVFGGFGFSRRWR